MKRNMVVFLIFSVVFLLSLLFFMFRNNTCNVGGFVGFRCDCHGIRIPIKSDGYGPDAMAEIICIGSIKSGYK